MRLPPPLVALSPGTLGAEGAAALAARVERACAGGLRGVVLREPGLDDGALLAATRALAALRERAPDLWLAVHDRPHVALAAGVDAVHLGFRSLPPGRVPREWRARLAVGLSTHASDDGAEWADADYLFHGPVRETPSKRGLVAPVGFEGLAAAVRRAPAPVWAIGGIEPEDAPAALAAGARGVAVLRGVLGAPDPEEAAARYGAALQSAGSARP